MKIHIRKRKLKNGYQSIFLDYYIQGERHIEFLNIKLGLNRKENKYLLEVAEKIRAKRLLELQNELHGFSSHLVKDVDFVEYFKKELEKKPDNSSSWLCSFKKLIKFTGGRISINKIDSDWMEKYKIFLISEVSPLTAHHYFSNLKHCINKAVKEGIIQKNPCSFVKNIKFPEVKREYLTIEEINILKETHCMNDEIKRAFLFSCATGLRFSDVSNITWKNIVGHTLEYRQKKTDRIEYLPLSESAKEILRCFSNSIIHLPECKIFNLPTKSRVSIVIRDWVKRSPINKKITFHSSRHTFATLSLIEARNDLYMVSKLLGHKDISTTQKYAKISTEAKQIAMSNFPKF